MLREGLSGMLREGLVVRSSVLGVILVRSPILLNTDSARHDTCGSGLLVEGMALSASYFNFSRSDQFQ